MATGNTTNHGYFGGLSLIIASAVAASSAVFTLFNGLLTNLVPPFENSTQSSAFSTFGTAIMLLALSVLIHKKLSEVRARTIAVICIILLGIGIYSFLHFRSVTRTYVYRYPPASIPTDAQTVHIRGDLHAVGQRYVQSKSIAQAVKELGGPNYVNSKGLLWTESSRLSAIDHIESLYLYLSILLTTALFAIGLTVWRFRQR